MTPYARWRYACMQGQIVSLPQHDTLYTVPTRKSKLHPVAVFQVSPETAAHKSYNCFGVYIIDGGQDWGATVVLFDILII